MTCLFSFETTYLYCDICCCCCWRQAEFEVLFIPAYTKMSSTLYAPVEPSAPNYALDPEYMLESIRGGSVFFVLLMTLEEGRFLLCIIDDIRGGSVFVVYY